MAASDSTWVAQKLYLEKILKKTLLRGQWQQNYVGVGSPVKSSFLAWLKESVFVVTSIHALVFALTFLPGFALLLLTQGRRLRRVPAVLWIVPIVSILGYVCFFVAFYSHVLGLAAAIGCVVGPVFIIAKRHSFVPETVRSEEFSTPLLLMFLVSLFYVLALYSADNGLGSWAANYRFSPAVWSSDNQLQQFVSERLYRGRTISGQFHPWTVSDRPPLLAGIFLLNRPFWDLVLAIGDNKRLLYYFYQISGIVLMTFWVIPVWLLFRGLTKRNADTILGIVMVGTSGFIFFNSIYIWPKILAGALALCAYFVLVQDRMRQTQELSLTEITFAGVTAALAMLAHGGVILGLVALGLMLVTPTYRIEPRTLLVGAAVFAFILLPRPLWQRLEDPPGNALVKFAFAGTFGFGQEDVGVLQTVREAYAKISFAE